ncbi:MAG: sensor histidine kinase [Acidovorax sp.]|uniref:sensor histidine kinase n=1 Tax=Acidovorax sp. TaxID=1872122 RepID=UPI00391A69D5
MFRTRPPLFALACVGIWALQLVLITVSFHWIGAVGPSMQRWWELAAVAASLALGGLLLVQLPRALQWRPRLNVRVSAEVMEERRRIAGDLHDSVGSQLISALAMLDLANPRDRAIHTVLEQGMLDLRLLVDSMDGAEAPIELRLAQLRYRMEPVLAQRGIRILWDVQAPQCKLFVHPDGAAHLVAIVQEALSNALQHANATEIAVSAKNMESDGCWCLEISDNGTGIPPVHKPEGVASAGYGIAGMSRRARLAGGELFVQERHAGGTSIRAVVPCIQSQ